MSKNSISLPPPHSAITGITPENGFARSGKNLAGIPFPPTKSIIPTMARFVYSVSNTGQQPTHTETRMTIEIIGMNCRTCAETERNVRAVVHRLELQTEIIRTDDVRQMKRY
ncbi:MAG: thioredoxin family protein, partial [Bacteroidota bacterium]